MNKHIPNELKEKLPLLRQFIPKQQMQVMLDVLKTEEAEGMLETFNELHKLISDMPETYGQDGLDPSEVTTYLHYFAGDFDWYITEKDSEDEQLQAYGYADMGYPEMGYIPITELVDVPAVNLDLHFKPTPLNTIKEEVDKKHSASPTRGWD